MWISSWNRDGLIHMDMIEQDRTMNAELELCKRIISSVRYPVALN